ncbi:MAG: Chromosome-partitioning protein Spo0J [Bacteroidetes bacterium ADurb.Bin035]|jgi:ParB family chromosome partitioning protein|nr:ParB/RepB/Spo0J family partition protein [Bacteroidales bacterium]OQC47574.1 MAG: Chromosome-partitioning protein Spo0J [Bacteroidetes bacterium ADurb.Bin035]MBP8946596.1 ParB/RepB/Spo0J family partition protein [Bacteroidales bacterium]HOC40270.1 ParB/RepB/Spo0J family partition protein [Bacteroidales bacterium]HPX45725.1 ParB/RepB/Spo0J family partition protein [Bacteroidales bacterium]
MSTSKRPALGRGLEAILGDIDNDYFSSSAFPLIPVDQIESNPFQPRTDFDEEALYDLADSIKHLGIIQPITVRKIGENKYQLISGERRLRAAKLANLNEIPAFVKDADDDTLLELALVENIQRQDLNAIEIANSYQKLLEEFNLTQEELSSRVGKNRATISNYLRILNLPPAIQAAIRYEKITMGHARALASIDDDEDLMSVFKKTIDEGLSVRKVEELVANLKNKSTAKHYNKNIVSEKTEKILNNLKEKFNIEAKSKVTSKGKVIVQLKFDNDEEIENFFKNFINE